MWLLSVTLHFIILFTLPSTNCEYTLIWPLIVMYENDFHVTSNWCDHNIAVITVTGFVSSNCNWTINIVAIWTESLKSKAKKTLQIYRNFVSLMFWIPSNCIEKASAIMWHWVLCISITWHADTVTRSKVLSLANDNKVLRLNKTKLLIKIQQKKSLQFYYS